LDGLAVDTPREYERIPDIWRPAIAAGKRNDAAELKRLLDLSLPKADEPLRHWQAVVIGGGIINGLSMEGVWPGRRITEKTKVSGTDFDFPDTFAPSGSRISSGLPMLVTASDGRLTKKSPLIVRSNTTWYFVAMLPPREG